MKQTQLLYPEAAQVTLLLNNKHLSNSPLGIYIHIPFCNKKCSYCNFYSGVVEAKRVAEYLKALIKEIKTWGGKICRPVNSVYIGGGTPSVLGADIALVLNAVRDSFHLLKDSEITVELNPEKDCEDFLYSAYNFGANRLSIGLQSANDDELDLLGRRHKAKDAENTVLKARKIGFKNISLDIMLGLPDSNIKKLENSLLFLKDLNPEHISAYILKLEEKTALSKRYDLNFPDSDEISEQYLFMCKYLESIGYSHYEISNFAKEDKESCHNLKYWQCEEYLGIGPAAHSFLDGRRFFYPADMKEFINSPKTVFDSLGGEIDEYIMLNLRLKKGLSFDNLFKLYGFTLSEDLKKFINMLESKNLAQFKNNTLFLTADGMLVSNTVITELLERIL